jgi:myo-inositol 2-dehydrogenase/D-chiro-inositol 1-dehydrogenase
MWRQPISIGLAGAGRLALRFHLPALLRLPRVTVSVVADSDAAARERAARMLPRAAHVSCWEALLDGRHHVDAIINCLPTPIHAATAVAFLRAVTPLYLEKPLAESAHDAREVARAWTASGTPCQIGFNFRFHPAVIRARELIAGGAIGRPLAIDAVLSNPPRPGTDGQLAPLRDLAVHHIDLARFLLIDEFACVISARDAQQPVAQILVDAATESGVAVRIHAISAGTRLDRLTIVGERGAVSLDRFGLDWTTTTGRSRWRIARLRDALHLARAASRQARRALAQTPDRSYGDALVAFLNALASRQPPAPDIYDGLRCAEVVDAAERALATGQSCTVSRASL